MEYNVPLLVLGVRKLPGEMRYEQIIEDVILPEEFAAAADAPRAITRRYSDALARLVRRHPEQYFWLHRRWKHQPKARRAAAA